MNIKRTQVLTFNEEAFCDCGGEFVCKLVLTSLPPQYVHKCRDCGKEETMQEAYPRTVYGSLDEEKRG